MIDQVQRYIIPAAYSVLPKPMNSPKATAMLLAICLQESKALHRKQLPRKAGLKPGPARGLWQFERGGATRGVMTHAETRGPLSVALTELRYADVLTSSVELHKIIEHNDVVAAVFARLLLWTVPYALPTRDEPGFGWKQYLTGWNPGEPHRETWTNYFIEAWQRVDRLEEELNNGGTQSQRRT